MINEKVSKASTKRAGRTARRQKQTREEIIAVAREVVLRDGFLEFSMASVAEEMGLTQPALYYYFKSRKALVSEILVSEWVESAAAVEAAVEETESGADAVERMMRVLFDRYRDKLDLFLLIHQRPSREELEGFMGPEDLARIRPVNDMLYGGAEERLRADQLAGSFPEDRDPRRFVFTAHTTVQGLLTMKAMVEAANDPLIHSDDDLIDDVCRTFRYAAIEGDSR